MNELESCILEMRTQAIGLLESMNQIDDKTSDEYKILSDRYHDLLIDIRNTKKDISALEKDKSEIEHTRFNEKLEKEKSEKQPEKKRFDFIRLLEVLVPSGTMIGMYYLNHYFEKTELYSKHEEKLLSEMDRSYVQNNMKKRY